MERRPQLNTREAKAASRLYIVSVYDHIQQSLDAGRTRAWIDESLDGREYAIDPKTLMTKFKEEKARRAV
jgi:hypothetical protein